MIRNLYIFIIIFTLMSSFVFSEDCSTDKNKYVFYDDFEDGVVDLSEWMIIETRGTVTESGGKLVLTSTDGTAGFDVIAAYVNLTDNTNVTIEFLEVETTTLASQSDFVYGNFPLATSHYDNGIHVSALTNEVGHSDLGGSTHVRSIIVNQLFNFTFYLNITLGDYTVYNGTGENKIGIVNRTANTGYINPDNFYINIRDSFQTTKIGMIRVYEGEFCPEQIDFISPTPENNAINNTQMAINVSCIIGKNASIWFDSNINPVTLVLDNASNPGEYTTSVSAGDYYYKASCNSGGINSSIRKWTFDNVSPIINLTSNNFFLSDNSSRLSPTTINPKLSINYSDNRDLFSYEIFITNKSDRTQIFYHQINNTLSGTQYLFEQIITFSNWSYGNYSFNTSISDSHTSLSIGNYIIEKSKDYLRFDGNIKITSQGAIASNTIKETDRYKFEFDYLKDSNPIKIYYIESRNKLIYRPNSEYKAHFIDPVEKKWIDFEGEGLGTPIVKKITDYKYKITYTHTKDKIIFSSIGGLNIVSQEAFFELAPLFPSDVNIYGENTLLYNYSGEFNQYLNASLNISIFNDIINNGCVCIGCSIVSDVCRIPTLFSSSSASTLEVFLYNATIYTNLTFNIYDRETEQLITTDTTISVQGFGNATTSTGILNLPRFPTDIQTYNAIVSSEGYITDQTEFTLTDQDSTNIDIYLINSSSGAVGNFIAQIFDEFYNFLVGANVKLLEYKESSDSFVEVSQCFSDSNGECIFNVELNTKYYIVQATFESDGNVITAQSTTNGQLVKIDNTVIELHLRTSEEFNLDNLYDLIIVPNNTTLVGNTSYLTATFNDAANFDHTVCIGYFTVNGVNEIEQDTTCVTGSAGIVNAVGGFLLDRSYTWIAKIYVIEDNGHQRVYNSYIYEAEEGTFLSAFTAPVVKAIILMIVLAILGLALSLKNFKIFAFGMMGFSPYSIVLYPDIIGGVTMSFMILMSWCILYLTAKKQELG